MTKGNKITFFDKNASPTFSAGYINLILDMSIGFGIDPAEIDAHIDQLLLEDPSKRVPVQFVNNLLLKLRHKIPDPDLGLHMGENFRITMDIVHLITFNSPTLKEALDNNFRYSDLLHDACRPALSIKGDSAIITLKVMIPDLAEYRTVVEYHLSYYFMLIAHLTGRGIKLDGIHFFHPLPSNIKEHQRIFNTSVQFDQKDNKLFFHKKYLNTPVLYANPELLTSFEHLAKTKQKEFSPNDTFSEQVIKVIIKELLTGRTDIDRISKTLGITTRSLQNRLKTEGTKYQELLEKVKKERAEYFLEQTDMSMIDITFLLGYSEQSAFNRAFKKWTGLTPIEYRLKK